MMSLTIFAAAAALAEADTSALTAQIDSIRMTLGRDEQGKPACRIDQSTGNDRLDEVMCRESVKCVKARPLPLDAMQACLNERRKIVEDRWARGRRT
jgi:hypothetical protein